MPHAIVRYCCALLWWMMWNKSWQEKKNHTTYNNTVNSTTHIHRWTILLSVVIVQPSFKNELACIIFWKFLLCTCLLLQLFYWSIFWFEAHRQLLFFLRASSQFIVILGTNYWIIFLLSSNRTVFVPLFVKGFWKKLYVAFHST